jgi:hypothetical protein
MDPIATAGVAKLLDFAFTAWLAGIERDAIRNKVQEMEASGASMDEITDALQAMRVQSEVDAQAKIDKL